MPNQLYDLRKTKHFIVDHRIVDEYLPALGGKAFQLYCIYCRIASSHNRVFPSFRALRKNTGFGFNQIAKCNQLLEELGLIKIVRETSKDGDRDNNRYFLLEPKRLAEELKSKYYPADWEPILKGSSGGAINSVAPQEAPDSPGGATKSVAQVLPEREHRATGLEARVLSGREHINNSSVVKEDITTTQAISQLVEAALPFCKTDSAYVVVGMEMILKSASKRNPSIEEAFQYVLEKIQTFFEGLKKADNPLAMLHAAVQHDWKDAGTVKKQEALEFKKQLERQNEEQERHKLQAWERVPSEVKATLYKDGLKWDFHKRTKKWPREEDLKEMMDELIKKGRYGIFDLSIPSPYFKLEEQG